MKKRFPITAPGMDVDRGQEAREMVDQPRQEIEPPAIEPVSDPVQRQRPGARIDQDFPARPGSRIPGFDGVEIVDQARKQTLVLPSGRQSMGGRSGLPEARKVLFNRFGSL
jgi:hypothetical protein